MSTSFLQTRSNTSTSFSETLAESVGQSAPKRFPFREISPSVSAAGDANVIKSDTSNECEKVTDAPQRRFSGDGGSTAYGRRGR